MLNLNRYLLCILYFYILKLFSDKMDFLKKIPTHMDYVGQGRAEKLYQIIIGRKLSSWLIGRMDLKWLIDWLIDWYAG